MIVWAAGGVVIVTLPTGGGGSGSGVMVSVVSERDDGGIDGGRPTGR